MAAKDNRLKQHYPQRPSHDDRPSAVKRSPNSQPNHHDNSRKQHRRSVVPVHHAVLYPLVYRPPYWPLCSLAEPCSRPEGARRPREEALDCNRRGWSESGRGTAEPAGRYRVHGGPRASTVCRGAALHIGTYRYSYSILMHTKAVPTYTSNIYCHCATRTNAATRLQLH